MSRIYLIRRSLEMSLVFVCVYTFVFTTPAGEVLRYGTNLIFGRKVKARSLVSYFDTLGAESKKKETAKRLATPLNPNDPLFAQAQSLGLNPHLARALFVNLSGGQLGTDGKTRISLSAAGQRSLTEVGIENFSRLAEDKDRRSQLLRGVAGLKNKFKSEQAAITALHIDWPLVEYALNRAKAAGISSPEEFRAFSRFLPTRERKKLSEEVASVLVLKTAFGLQSPVQGAYRVSSRFGYRVHPVLKKRKKHTGIDLAVPTGTALYASEGGLIVYAASDGVNGKFVKIDHGYGLSTAYCHASKLLVKRGQRVKAGQRIALSGMSGRATGPHLHFQVEIDDTPIDPELFIQSFKPNKPLSLGPKINTHTGGLAEDNLDVSHRRRRQYNSYAIEQFKLRGI